MTDSLAVAEHPLESRLMSKETTTVVVERHFDLEDQAADPYPLIPFDLPPGITRLDVRYTYSDPISPDPLTVYGPMTEQLGGI
jgi:hypothetical protein